MFRDAIIMAEKFKMRLYVHYSAFDAIKQADSPSLAICFSFTLTNAESLHAYAVLFANSKSTYGAFYCLYLYDEQ
ncbi:hypothetical protein ABT56_17545 [Photobacterium aquae]|uniref:Uncharacterized protein n=1 Tax=Photobacterium aquae TaxID=1195763 RepID=A0A0J1GVP2_9GAMM|nr:hypothetical protein ABT56_17545 [Photobacterium aquae]